VIAIRPKRMEVAFSLMHSQLEAEDIVSKTGEHLRKSAISSRRVRPDSSWLPRFLTVAAPTSDAVVPAMSEAEPPAIGCRSHRTHAP
jgi:hypothetical protein